jgi:hypothetical protein
MRTPIVALVCDPDRSAVGTFFRASDGALMLEEYAFLPAAASAEAALWSAVAQRVKGGATVVLAPPATATLTKFVTVPRLRRSQRERVVRFEAGQAIPRPLAETAWDWAPAGVDGNSIELAAMKFEAAESLCAEAERAGCRVETIVARVTALTRAARHNYPESAAPTVLVEVVGNTALIVRPDAKRPAVRLAGLPARTEVLARGTGGERDSGNLRLRRLAAEIKRLTSDSESGGASGLPTTVLLAGTDVPEPEELAPHVGADGVKLERFNALCRVKLGSAVGDAAADASSLGALVGAALAASDESAPNILPKPRRRENAFRRNRVRWLTLVGATVFSLWGAVWAIHHAIGRKSAEVVELTREMQPWRAAQQTVAERQRQIDAGQRELAVLQGLERARTSWPRFFGDAQSRCERAGGVWLESVQLLSADANPATGGLFGRAAQLRPADGVMRQRLAITGCAQEVWGDGRRSLERVRGFLRDWAEADAVATVESERFDASAPGLLRFSCVLVLKPEAGL